MPRFAANLSFMYGEHTFLDRFQAAARDGFRAVEFLFPYEFDVRELRSRLDSNGLTQALFNAPPGDWEKGERGLASLPGREEEFQASIKRALEYAAVLGNERLHVMAGLIEPGLLRSAHRPVYVESLAWAAAQAASKGVTIVIEPINARDMPVYFIHRQDEAHANLSGNRSAESACTIRFLPRANCRRRSQRQAPRADRGYRPHSTCQCAGPP
jgi:hydroxypyruvate isomerase